MSEDPDESLFLDPSSRYDFFFAVNLVNGLSSSNLISEDYYRSCVTLTPKDHEVNPFEDHWMIEAYLHKMPVSEIATRLKRKVKVIQLRLRMLLQIRVEVKLNDLPGDKEGIELICRFFSERAKKFYAHCKDIVWQGEYMDLMNENIDTWLDDDVKDCLELT